MSEAAQPPRAEIDGATRDFYQTKAREWAEAFPYEFSKFLDPFLAQLPPGAEVLELGCGDGRDGARMEAQGFTVDATDGTPAMAALAEEKLGRPARHMEFGDLKAEAAYDAVWAHASLHHQPLVGLADVLARIHRAMRPGALFFANYKLGDGEHRDSFGRLYNFPPRAELMALYAAQDWEILEAHDYKDGGLDKVLRDWIAITVRKSA
ncbi:class I SAM-dependent DNA methyltransferase [Alteraurantiacibacter aquimixticola]|uniref:Class I SAM-dependent methyltransferase n=1 Tax=Alteraurantiacibacter aquimixticola TaxID=2489173 RepID=A0A4T3F4D6_9SPHN|nr:class I SAM-dependent methyltransferase [Alteraurantiacibacter aquimixticola]TIX50368.1 class I SAM-dependent methyltransferase [Alteraurantiacibacter aquimixticola]